MHARTDRSGERSPAGLRGQRLAEDRTRSARGKRGLQVGPRFQRVGTASRRSSRDSYEMPGLRAMCTRAYGHGGNGGFAPSGLATLSSSGRVAPPSHGTWSQEAEPLASNGLHFL
jgi:hypothetical protein